MRYFILYDGTGNEYELEPHVRDIATALSELNRVRREMRVQFWKTLRLVVRP
jgi:hypothetical protein